MQGVRRDRRPTRRRPRPRRDLRLRPAGSQPTGRNGFLGYDTRRPHPPVRAGHVTGIPHPMTFRAKPVVKRAHRPAWEGPGPTELLPEPRLRPDRRHRRRDPRRRGRADTTTTTISRRSGASTARRSPRTNTTTGSPIETWRLDEDGQADPDGEVVGRPPDADAVADPGADPRPSRRNDVTSNTLERLIDQKLQAKLAAEEGVTRRAAGHRRPAGDRGDDARDAPRLGHRGRRRRPTPAPIGPTDRPEGGGEGQGRRRR